MLAGLLEQNGAKLIQDKVSVLGDNDSVKLLAFDGCVQQATIDDAFELSEEITPEQTTIDAARGG